MVALFALSRSLEGRLRSRTKEDILEEFHRLLDQGVKEFNLIAQDLAAFGMDRGKTEFVELLKEMLKDQRYFWLRCLYLFLKPSRILWSIWL
jgi:ribosomal protein S12 methylthiotransferase